MAGGEPKVALVTGAASGIGAATVRLLHTQGIQVWAADRREFQFEVPGGKPGTVRELIFDVTSEDGWAEATARIVSESGGLHILVNAAGISRGAGDPAIGTTSLEDWRRVMAVNVEGTLLGCQQAMRVMATRGGAIVNISSTAALLPSQALGAYGASKAAVLQLTRSVAAACALQRLSIRCNAVLPGMTETAMTQRMTGDYRARWESQIPTGRFATADEVAATIVFLASDAASYVNGASLAVDGGLLSRPVVS